jgi:MFS family permease
LPNRSADTDDHLFIFMKGRAVMEMITLNNNNDGSNHNETRADAIATFACAFACMAALPMGLRAGWELDLTPMALACVLGGGWSLGIAAGGYASLFWKRLHTPRGRAAMLVVAAWAVGGLCSAGEGSSFLVLLGMLALVSAALFASQFRPRAATLTVLLASGWAIAGAAAALLILPVLFQALLLQLGTYGAWRMALVLPAAVLIAAAAAGYELTRGPEVENTHVDETDQTLIVSSAMPAAA